MRVDAAFCNIVLHYQKKPCMHVCMYIMFAAWSYELHSSARSFPFSSEFVSTFISYCIRQLVRFLEPHSSARSFPFISVFVTIFISYCIHPHLLLIPHSSVYSFCIPFCYRHSLCDTWWKTASKGTNRWKTAGKFGWRRFYSSGILC